MEIAILSRNRKLYSTSHLIEACNERGIEVQVIDPMNCNLVMGRKTPKILYNGTYLRDIDAVIPRIGASITNYGLAVVNHFEMMGIPVLNPSAAIARSRDKLRSMQLLSRMDVDIPRTFICREREDLQHAIEYVGGFPVILKIQQGTQGVGVMLADSFSSCESILDTFYSMGHTILIQQFVKESKGKDIRALVLGDRVVASMKRQAKMGEFRSNIHRGGVGTPVDLLPADAAVCIEAAQAMGLHIAGVDFLDSHQGPKIIEVNSSPGFEGLEQATGLDIASEMIDFTVDFAQRYRAGEIEEPPRIG